MKQEEDCLIRFRNASKFEKKKEKEKKLGLFSATYIGQIELYFSHFIYVFQAPFPAVLVEPSANV